MSEVFNVGDRVLVFAFSLSLELESEEDGKVFLIRGEEIIAKIE